MTKKSITAIGSSLYAKTFSIIFVSRNEHAKNPEITTSLPSRNEPVAKVLDHDGIEDGTFQKLRRFTPSIGESGRLGRALTKFGKYFRADSRFDASRVNEAIHPCIEVAAKLIVEAAVYPDRGPDNEPPHLRNFQLRAGS
jgi:hypothetical protein